MDTEKIARLVKELRVSSVGQGNTVTIPKEDVEKGKERLGFSVVGKIFSRKIANMETLRYQLPKILRSRGSSDIEMVEQNLFMITFTLESDEEGFRQRSYRHLSDGWGTSLERLSEFCYCCGRVRHISRDCDDGAVNHGQPGFGGWLRAGRSFNGRQNADSGDRLLARGTSLERTISENEESSTSRGTRYVVAHYSVATIAESKEGRVGKGGGSVRDGGASEGDGDSLMGDSINKISLASEEVLAPVQQELGMEGEAGLGREERARDESQWGDMVLGEGLKDAHASASLAVKEKGVLMETG